ncbi:hypothetical protein V3F56_06200 [Moorellaceae bacterium AZ2]
MNRAERLFCRFFRWVNPDVTDTELAYYLEYVRQEFWCGIVEDEQLLEADIALRLSLEGVYAAWEQAKTVLREVFRRRWMQKWLTRLLARRQKRANLAECHFGELR